MSIQARDCTRSGEGVVQLGQCLPLTLETPKIPIPLSFCSFQKSRESPQLFLKLHMHQTVVASQEQESLELSLSECEWLVGTYVKVDVV
jgi:hypothetical protein